MQFPIVIYTLHHIIEEASKSVPHAIAFSCLNKTLSYSELELKANQLSHHLISVGIQKGNRVGIFMNRCIETAIAVYGILKSGAAYVPLDPFAPISRTVTIVDDCQIACLISTPQQQSKIDTLVKSVPRIKNIVGCEPMVGPSGTKWEDIFAQKVTSAKRIEILEDDLAFILYTSGSTVKPKGIMHTHYSALSLAKIVVDTFDFDEDDIFGNPAPLHFDPSTFGYFVAPLVMAKTIIVPDAHLRLPVSLSALIAKEKISVWYSVPLMLIQLLQSNTLNEHDFSSLRWVFFAGEVFIPKHLKALMEVWPHAKYCNLYGPAELILCTYHELKETITGEESIPIGRTWANTEHLILNEQNQPVRNGETGELALRSATLMRGYWNNVELTEKSFHRIKVANGYDHIYYRSGDLVKLNKDGELLFLGRNDRQIKLRGYRIELDEVESVFLKHEKVLEVAVVVIALEKEGQELAVAIKLKEDSDVSEAELRHFSSEILPAYAVPTYIEIFDDFPRTSSGKINRRQIADIIDQN
ncbi:MAG: D-alanine--poly(phosphoribitol) ligase [Pseudozobellia sp.]|nr:D-alanine--poly(phosphoribitol) ligase [Pseudozobellia sp.]